MKITSGYLVNAMRRLMRASVAGFALVAVPVAVMSASGLGTKTAQAASQEKYLRMGVGKSVVLRLPRPASEILVGNDKIVRTVLRTKRTVYLFGLANGQTNIFFLDENGRQILALNVEVSQNVKALQRLLQRALPGSAIVADMVGKQLVLRGEARSPEEAKKAMDLASKFSGNVVNAMTIAGRDQVTIKVRIAEVQRSVAKQYGINWHKLLEAGDFTTQVIMANPFSLGQALGSTVVSRINPLDKLGLAGPGVGITNSSGKTAAVLRAMERDGLVRTLAEPTLTAVSGEEAKFLAGGEIPMPTGYDPDTKQVTYSMREIGVTLSFKPVVRSASNIRLKIKTEVSEVSSRYTQRLGEVSYPGLEKRSAETTVEIPSGGTLAIGGLIHDVTKSSIDGVPGLKNLPVLGALFRSNDFLTNQTELVIFATPYIVKPVSEKKLRTPIDGLALPSDAQMVLFGRLQRVYGAPTGPKGSGRVYHGDVGFIVE